MRSFNECCGGSNCGEQEIKKPSPLILRIEEIDNQIENLNKLVVELRDRLHPVLLASELPICESERCDKNPESPVMESLSATLDRVKDVQSLIIEINQLLTI